MYSIGELRPGMAIVIEEEPFLILSAQHSKQARAGGVVRTKMKNLLSGVILTRTFQGNEKLTPADVSYKKTQYLYNDDDGFYFMDEENFEQFMLSHESIDEQSNFLKEGMSVDSLYFGEMPIGIKLPPKVDLEVVETDPGVKGDTASGGTKPATVETGFKISVPLFVAVGDLIRINTESGSYVERA